MRKFLVCLVLVVLSTAFSSQSFATGPGQYLVAGGELINGKGFDLPRLYVGYGVRPNRYFAFEGQIGRGIKSDSLNNGMGDVGLKSGFGYGAFAIGRLPFGSIGSDVFLRAGYVDLNVGESGGSIGRSADLSGLAFGLGFHIFQFQSGGLRVDFTRVNEEAETFSVAYVLSF